MVTPPTDRAQRGSKTMASVPLRSQLLEFMELEQTSVSLALLYGATAQKDCRSRSP
jgi:hypothetical protein